MWQEELTFTNRKEAGLKLAQALAKYKSESPIVLAVPRGGVPVVMRLPARSPRRSTSS